MSDLEQRAKEVAWELRAWARTASEACPYVSISGGVVKEWADKLNPPVKRQSFWMVWDKDGKLVNSWSHEVTAKQETKHVGGTCLYYPSPEEDQ